MGITMTIEIYDEEDAMNMVAAMKVLGGVLIEYIEEEDE